jgi:hypothetical protein
VIDPIEDALNKYKSELGIDPFCVIFTPATAPPSNAFYYASRIKGDDSINAAITNACKSARILNIGYNFMGSKGDWSDNSAWGKLALEWKGSASSCAAGSSILNVFAEQNWWQSLHFDDDGNPVANDNTSCQSEPGSDDVFDEGP